MQALTAAFLKSLKDKAQNVDRSFIVIVILFVCFVWCSAALFPVCQDLSKNAAVINRRLKILRAYQVYFNSEAKDLIQAANKIQDQAADQDVSDILRELQKLSQESGIIVGHMAPKAQPTHKNTNQVSVQMDFLTSEAGWMKFLSGLEKISYLSMVKISLRSVSKSVQQLYGEVTIEKTRRSYGKDFGFLREASEENISIIWQFLKRQKEPLFVPSDNKILFKKSYEPVFKNIYLQTDNSSEKLKNFNLVGIVDDGAIKAVIEDKTTGKSYFFQVADMLDDLKVVAINTNNVVFEAGGQQHSLMI